jgi:hypothetical protein
LRQGSIAFRAEAGREIEDGADIGIEARDALVGQPVELRLAAAVAEGEHRRLRQPFEDKAYRGPAVARHRRDPVHGEPRRPRLVEQQPDIPGDAAVAHARRLVEPAQLAQQGDGGAPAFLAWNGVEHASLLPARTINATACDKASRSFHRIVMKLYDRLQR